MGPWEGWQEKVWSELREKYGQMAEVKTSQLQAEISPPKFATTLGGSDISYGVVQVNKDLCGGEIGLTKKHMEIELPIGASYRSGDYMVILPLNNSASVR
jgi:cytochrome P450/NADPH-cytochrome P450 reductase